MNFWEGLLKLMIASMIFFPEKAFYEKPADYGLIFENALIRTSDGVDLHGWYLPAPGAKAVLLFFHGNAGNISGRLAKADGWVRRGYAVCLVDYRGYGASQGRIEHQDDVMRDAEASLEWLMKEKNWPLSKVVFYGESLGTHPAIRLGVEHSAAAVILEAPFTSFADLGKIHYPFVPSALVRDFTFPNEDYIAGLKAPLFILHGMEDEICPYAMAGELFEKAPLPKEFFSIADGRHNDLPIKAGEDYWDKPAAFLEKILSEKKNSAQA
ncbi:MAG: alpha/beta hydrolase [Candidatus Omnitrophica bacterium]|nr:alpha/beta hydrolase [Candidatus Omnitrophota bacterium]